MAKKSIAKNYLYNLTYQILTLLLPLVTASYLARALGATATGIYSYTYTIVNYFVIFGSLGIALYGQREIAYVQNDKEKRKKIFIELVLFRSITLIFATIIYYFIDICKQFFCRFYTFKHFKQLFIFYSTIFDYFCHTVCQNSGG